MLKKSLLSRYPILDHRLLRLSFGWKIKFITLVLLLSIIDLVATFSIAILIGYLANGNERLYFNLNVKFALFAILIFAVLKPQFTLLVNRYLSRRQAELEMNILQQFLDAELAEIRLNSNSHKYSKVLNRIEGELATIFNDFFPALILLATEMLFLLFTLTFFLVNYPLPTIIGTFCVIPLINFSLKNSMKRIKSLQLSRSKLYAQTLKDLLDVTSGLKESLVLGNFRSFYGKYLKSKTKLVEAKFAQDIESNYQKQLVEGSGLVALGLFTLVIQFDFISNDVSKSMLVIAFAIRLTPSFSRISNAISRANSTVPVMRKIILEVDLNSRDQLFGSHIKTGLQGTQSGILLENLSIVTNGKYLIRDLNLDLRPGDILGIEGPSGSGKTILLETIAGLRYPHAGQIVMSTSFFQNMAYLKQEPHIMDESVGDNIRYLRGDIPDLTIQRFVNQLEIPNDEQDSLSIGPGVFSGGEKQRLALARTLAEDPKLILLDEPTSAQDFLRRDLIMKLVSSDSEAILIICSHSSEILSSCTKNLKLG
jgi:ABC-type multidrug transport system fused ATPase/permease subunit